MVAYQISRIGEGRLIVLENELNCLVEDLKESALGDWFLIKKIEISQEKIDSLPEFAGW